MNEGNYIKISRKILEWEWYQDINTKTLFFHMLIKCNWKDGKFQGKTVSRGSFVSSISKLSVETHLTEREVRTAISHLKTTGELTSKATNKFTVFTVLNYDLYQSNDRQIDKLPSNDRQASDKQTTFKRHSNDIQTTTIEERKKERREKGKKERNNIYTAPEKMRHKRGDYGHVLLSDEEVERLGKDYGEDKARQAVQYLDEYMQMHGKSYKDCNLAIRKWVIDAVNKKRAENNTVDKQQQSREMMYNWAMNKEGQNGS